MVRCQRTGAHDDCIHFADGYDFPTEWIVMAMQQPKFDAVDMKVKGKGARNEGAELGQIWPDYR